MIQATDTPLPHPSPAPRGRRPALLSLAPLALAPLVVTTAAPAWADAPAAAPPGHHGVPFTARKGAQARIVEPDGRIVTTDGVSDLVAPASIASRQAHSAIARLINAEAVDKGLEVQSLAAEPAASDSSDGGKAASRREPGRGLKFGSVTPGV